MSVFKVTLKRQCTSVWVEYFIADTIWWDLVLSFKNIKSESVTFETGICDEACVVNTQHIYFLHELCSVIDSQKRIFHLYVSPGQWCLKSKTSFSNEQMPRTVFKTGSTLNEMKCIWPYCFVSQTLIYL